MRIKKIKILMIVTSKLDRGGIDSYLLMLLQNWDMSKVHADFVVHTKDQGSSEETIREFGCHIYKLPRAGRHPFRYYKELLYIIKKGQYDIVHRHGDASTAFVGLMAAKHAGVKVRVMHSHNNNWKHHVIHKGLRPLILYYATDYFACSKDAGDWMYGCGSYKVMHNGIDTEKYKYNSDDREKYRQTLKLDEKYVMINVGRLAYQKNQSWIIRLAEKIRDQNIVILIVGDGPLEYDLKREIGERNLGDVVKMLGGRDDIPQLLSASDIAILPSHYEGLGIALIEAQCNGLPCLASTNVAHEANLGKVSFLDLEFNLWEEEIHKLKNTNTALDDRLHAYKNVEKHEYSADKAADMVMQSYIDALNREKKSNG